MKTTVELLNRKAFGNSIYEPFQLLDVFIEENGVATVLDNPVVGLKPHEYRVFIPEQDFDKLLGVENV